MTPLVTKGMVDTLTKRPRKPLALTPRQREVLQLVAEGRSVKQIARLLEISPRTVEFHQTRIRETLGVRSTAELTRYAIRSGIVSD